jgi:hypothetical protein
MVYEGLDAAGTHRSVKDHLFDQTWQEIRTKTSLRSKILRCTRIPISVSVLTGEQDVVERTSVAQRMAWASSRQTTRVEDIAYCLLGIFGVNTPLLYGEGERAVIRLQ